MSNFEISLSVVLLSTAACGGNVGANDTPGAGSGGDAYGSSAVGGTQPTGAGGNTVGVNVLVGGAPGSGASANAGAGAPCPGGLTQIQPGTASSGPADMCVGWNAEIEPLPLAVQFVTDVGISMNDTTPNTNGRRKWDVTRDALAAAIDSMPGLTALGLLLYPNRSTNPNSNAAPISIDNCVNTAAAVPIRSLAAMGSQQRVIVLSGLAAALPQGGRPTEDAYSYALNNLLLPFTQTNVWYQPYLVLITDGQPTIASGCADQGQAQYPVDGQPIVQAISDAWTNFSIKTLVIGLPGSESSATPGVDGRSWLSQAAQAGHLTSNPGCNDSGNPSFCHDDLTKASDLLSGIETALQALVAAPLPCAYTIPPPTNGQVIDTRYLTVVYNQNAVNGIPTAQYLVGQSDPSCSQGDGWYASANGQLTLSAKTCAMIQQDPNPTISIRGGCFPFTLPN